MPPGEVPAIQPRNTGQIKEHRNMMYTPIHPGAMTPAQMLQKIQTAVISIAVGAVATAIFTIIIIIFN